MEAPSYEIEIRFRMDTEGAAYDLLPFLEESLGQPASWSTDILGRSIYDDGRLLRIGRVPTPQGMRLFLGAKGPDVGRFANIRQEWGEEISDGVARSAILAQLGIDGHFATSQAVEDALTAAGHLPFMSFSGVDRLGFYAPLDLHTKISRCEKIVGDDVLIELELAADSLEAASKAEEKLRAIAQEYGIINCLFRAEPPTLLFQHTFPNSAATA